MVVVGIVGVKADSLLISSQRFLVTLEVRESIAFVMVVVGVVGVKADGLLIGGQRFLVTLEAIEGIAFSYPFLFGFEGDEQVFNGTTDLCHDILKSLVPIRPASDGPGISGQKL